MKQVLYRVRVLDENGAIHTLDADELELSYRSSVFHRNRQLVILSAEFRLNRGSRSEIEDRMNQLMAARLEKQPLDYPSCGSTFKRPEGAYASKLIEQSGLRGFSVGGAQVSEKHCGFVINRGGATSSDILKLIAEIQRIVKEKTGYWLEPEVEILR